MPLAFPSSVKYINRKGQKQDRIWATRVCDRVLYEIFPVPTLDTSSEVATLKEQPHNTAIPQQDNL
jgi:hypothetical protein